MQMPRRDGRALPAVNVVTHSTGARLGTLHGRAWADTVSAGAVLNVVGPEEPTRGTTLALTWRGDDARGSFQGQARVRLPFTPTTYERWNILTVTRAGVLADLQFAARGDVPNSEPERGLAWLSPRGAVRIADPTPAALSDLVALPLADGGAVLMGGFDVYAAPDCGRLQQVTRRVLVAAQLGADGTVLWRRVMPDTSEFDSVAGFAEVEGRWGVAFTGHGHDDTMVARMLDGTTVPLGNWRTDTTPRICGDAEGPVKVHAVAERDEHMHTTVTAENTEGEITELAQTQTITFERDDRGVCLRQLMAARMGESYEVHVEDFRNAWEPVRLRARGGALVGVIDEGTRIDLVHATLSARNVERE